MNASHEAAALRTIDRASPIPYYYQLQEILKEEIENGAWRPLEILPSESELERRFKVSRTVVRQALDVLQADGQIRRVKGKGSIVAEPKFRWEGTVSARDWGQVEASGQPVLGRIVDQRWVPAGGHVGRLLEMASGDTVLELTYSLDVSGKPAAVSQMYVRVQAGSALAALLDSGGPPALSLEPGVDIHDQLATRYGIRVVVSHLTLELTSANEFETELLRVAPGSPAFLLAAVDIDSDRRAVAFTRSVIRGDQFRFSVILERAASVADTAMLGLHPSPV